MEEHILYEQRLGHREDFKVTYVFYTQAEGGRYSLPFQGLRSNFYYESLDHILTGVFMIWPEFQDRNGNLIEEGEVFREGIARMWIIRPEMRPYHQQRIKIGTRGYFKEGNRSTGVCEVIELVGLHKNPIA